MIFNTPNKEGLENIQIINQKITSTKIGFEIKIKMENKETSDPEITAKEIMAKEIKV